MISLNDHKYTPYIPVLCRFWCEGKKKQHKDHKGLPSGLDIVDLDTPVVHPGDQRCSPNDFCDGTLPGVQHRLPTKQHPLVKHKAWR